MKDTDAIGVRMRTLFEDPEIQTASELVAEIVKVTGVRPYICHMELERSWVGAGYVVLLLFRSEASHGMVSATVGFRTRNDRWMWTDPLIVQDDMHILCPDCAGVMVGDTVTRCTKCGSRFVLGDEDD